ncbi:MAG TPA: prepilin-type N-terminal cleavage/methylation domain-containing protein [Gemmatimonadaceae bacterium]|nr:prepilin-type N-terminal cleavage/methylation domain-containing protein [Gemmatimonadaceae bacterium]
MNMPMLSSNCAPRSPSPRRGLSVIEIIVAISVLGIVMAVVGRLSMTVNRYGQTNDLRARRNFAMQQQVDFVGGLAYANLNPTTLPASKIFTSGDFSYTRRMRIDSSGAGRRVLTVTVVPRTSAARDTLQKDTFVIVRSNPSCATVLNTGC